MNNLSESIFDLLKETAASASRTQSRLLAEATFNTLDAMENDGLIEAKDAWAYQSILKCMVESGALKVSGHDALSSRMRLRDQMPLKL
jgi:hypothetical protein